MDVLLAPPVAFLLYCLIVVGLLRMGRLMAGPAKSSALKTSTYASGEEAPEYSAAPGYRPFFLIAFFFAFLHLGILVLGTGGNSKTEALYLGGVLLTLLALILG